MGAIFQRKDGRWAGMLSLGWKNGKRRRKTFYGRTPEEVAQSMEAWGTGKAEEPKLNLSHAGRLGELRQRILKEVGPDGYVYLLFDGAKYKIGYSADVQARLRNMNCANPDLRLVASIPTANRSMEKLLHREFQAVHITKEFFRLAEWEVRWFKAVASSATELARPMTVERDEAETRERNARIAAAMERMNNRFEIVSSDGDMGIYAPV